MRRPATVFLLLASTLLFLACNGDGNGPDDGGPRGGGGGSVFSAKIDGKSWEASTGMLARAEAGIANIIIITGTHIEGNQRASTLSISLYNVSSPGEYPLGMSSMMIGGIATVGEGSGNVGQSWITPHNGAAGTVNITTLGDGRIAGTFQFSAEAGFGAPEGSGRRVTDGRFDMPLDGAPGEGNGHRLSATLGGEFYNAASMIATYTPSSLGNRIIISTTTVNHGLVIIIDDYKGPGAYALSNGAPLRAISAGMTGSTENCCWGLNVAGSTGEVVVASDSGNRLQGTFSATLRPQTGTSATGNLDVTEGSFDIGLTTVAP